MSVWFHPIFPTPFYRVQIQEHDAIEQFLPISKIKEIAVHHPPWHCDILTTFVHGSDTPDNLQEWQIRFQEICNNYFQQFTKLVYNTNGRLVCKHPWINLYRKGSFQEWHHHLGGTMFSFCYFYKIPDHPDSGKLLFRSRNKDLEYDYPDKFRLNASFDSAPKQNELFIFPCWVEHRVTQHNCDEERITISGNFSFLE